jgi:hypothetical protein
MSHALLDDDDDAIVSTTGTFADRHECAWKLK